MRETLVGLALAAAAVFVAFFFLNKYQDKQAYQEQAAIIMADCITASQQAEKKRKKTAGDLHKALEFFKATYKDADPQYSGVVALCEKFYQWPIDLKARTLEIKTELTSDRMKNPDTMKDKAEYEWRVKTLNNLDNIIEAKQQFSANTYESWRQIVNKSDLDDDTKVAINLQLRDLIDAFPKLSINAKKRNNLKRYSEAQRTLIDYLHNNPSHYRVENGNYVFSNADHEATYRSIYNEAEATSGNIKYLR